MSRNLRSWITASVALTGAAFFVVPPTAEPLTDSQAQHRPVQLTSYDEFDFSQLISTTTTNLDALENYFSTNPFLTDPDVSQGLSTLFSDLAAGTSNPVTNPLSLLTEGALALLSPGYGFGAASSALYGVSDNVQAALSSGDYSTALTDLENGPSTVLYAALNGYPDNVGNGLTSPEFGLLTSPDGSDLATGSIYAVDQLQNTLAAELSALGGGDLTTTTDLLGPNAYLDLSVSLAPILSALGADPNLTVDALIGELLPSGANLSVATLLSDAGITGVTATLIEKALGSTINIPASTLESALGSSVGDENLATLLGSLLPPTLSLDVPIPDLTGTFPTFDVDLSQDLLSVLGSIAPISADLPTLLTPDPTLDLIPLLTSVVGDLGLPVDIVGGDLPANLTGIVADIFSSLVP